LFHISISAQPTIATFSPTSGTVGTIVTITGTNFNLTPANNIVFFGATQATVSTSNATQLTVIVPVGTTYQYISATDLSTRLTAYSSKPFIVTFSCSDTINSGTFSPHIDFGTGYNPKSVSISDLDGDLKPDIVIVNSGNGSGNTISVYRNTSISGTISFATKVDYSTGTFPFSIAIEDIDGDGKKDLAIVNYNDNTISVYKNTCNIGTISFLTELLFSTGSNPSSISINDINLDGKPDIAITYQNDSTISIFKNTSTSGTISFATKLDFFVGSSANAKSLTIGDLDGDGKPDIVVTNYSTNSISILRNTSSIIAISFASYIDYLTGTNPLCVKIGDLDGDEKPDIAVSNMLSSVSVFRNTCSVGNISFDSKVDYFLSGQPSCISIGDIDGDGKADLAISNYSLTKVSVLRNICTVGLIAFAAKVDFIAGGWPYSISIGDIDGDGKPDIALANNLTHILSVLKQNDCTTEIESYLNNKEIVNIFPNPFNIQTTISFEKEQKNITINIIDVLGNLIKKMDYSGKDFILEKGKIKAGVYFIQVVCENEITASKKIVIL